MAAALTGLATDTTRSNLRFVVERSGLSTWDLNTRTGFITALETGLGLALGVRRHEKYLQDFWMTRATRRPL